MNTFPQLLNVGENNIKAMKKSIKVVLCSLVVLIMMVQVSLCETNTPLNYFKGRNSFSKHLKRNVESKPFFAQSNQRIKSTQGLSEQYSRMTPTDDMFVYDGVLNFDTVNIDLNPYVVDVGCTDNKLFIRVENSAAEQTKKYFKAGSAIVSSKYGFSCTRNGLGSHQVMKDELIYRYIAKSQLIQTQGVSYFEIETENLSLTQLISRFSFQVNKNPTDRKTTTTSKRWSAQGINVAKFTWKFNTESESGPATKVFAHNFKEVDGASVSCPNCYAAIGIGFSFALSSENILPDSFTGTVNYDVVLNALLNAKLPKQELPYPWQLFPEGDIYTLNSIWIVPISFKLSGKLGFEVLLTAEVDIDVRFNYKLSGSASFTLSRTGINTDVLMDPASSKPDFGVDYRTVVGDVNIKLLSAISINILKIFKMEIEFNPELQLIATNSLSPNCKLGVDTKAGLSGGFTLQEWNIFGLIKGEKFNYPFDFYPMTRIPFISNICVHSEESGRRKMLQLEDVAMVQSDTCCSIALNDSTTYVGANIIIPSDSYDFYDAIMLKLGYTKNCLVQYGNKTITSSSDSVQIQLGALKSENTSVIKVIFEKSVSEVVTVDYSYTKSSIELGKETKSRSGFVIVDIQQTVPALIAVRVTGGVLTKQTGEVVNEIIDTTKETFPIVWYFEGEGTITLYPFYNAYSGKTISQLVLKSLRFGLIYNGNAINTLTLDSLKLYSSSTSSKSSDSLDMTVKVKQLSEIKSSDIYAFTNPETSKSLSFSTQFSTPSNYIIFDLVGNVNFYFKVEPLELYSRHVNTALSLKYESISPFGLRITQDATWAKSGLVITIGKNTFSCADGSIISESTKFNSIFRTLSSNTTASFGFSKYSMSEWIGKNIYLRMEPKDSYKGARALGSKFSGSLDIDSLKNENITVGIKFYNSADKSVVDTISLNALTSEHKYYMSIIINDAQYTFNEFALSTISNFVNFLNTIRTKQVDSKWNTVILPLLSYSASTATNFDFTIISPQEMRFKLPVYPTLESSVFTENIDFSSLDTSIFTPSPRKVASAASITVFGDNKLTGGEIGAIIASTVGFTIIVIILVVAICIFWKKPHPQKDIEMTTNKQ